MGGIACRAGYHCWLMDVDTGTAVVNPASLDRDEADAIVAKWPFWVAGGMVLLAIAVVISMMVTVPYIAFSPGPVIEIDEMMVLAAPDPLTGEFYMLTVATTPPLTVLEFIVANFDNESDIYAREAIRPSGISDEEYAQRNRDLMDESKTTAVLVALERSGFEVTYTGEGVLVAGFSEGAPVEGILMADDVIVAVDGTEVSIAGDFISLVSDRNIGEEVELTLLRDGETLTKSVTLIPHVDDPDRPMVGFLATTYNFDFVTPIDVDIDDDNIGGPSAGLMYTLTLMDLLLPDDLSSGAVIAGTGTIRPDGSVGPIGGVRQKVFAASDIGAEYMLVPADNWDEAQTADADIELIRVATIDDAIEFLASLG